MASGAEEPKFVGTEFFGQAAEEYPWLEDSSRLSFGELKAIAGAVGMNRLALKGILEFCMGKPTINVQIAIGKVQTCLGEAKSFADRAPELPKLIEQESRLHNAIQAAAHRVIGDRIRDLRTGIYQERDSAVT